MWPPGTVGAISHCQDYCAALAASIRDFGGLGLDAERRRRVGERLAQRVCTPAELRRIAALGSAPEWATVTFSAKEAGFKALNPLVNHFVRFADSEVDIDRSTNALVVRIIGGRLRGLELYGRFSVLPRVIVTAITLTPDAAAAIAGRPAAGPTRMTGHAPR